jgi:hypothetical protein
MAKHLPHEEGIAFGLGMQALRQPPALIVERMARRLGHQLGHLGHRQPRHRELLNAGQAPHIAHHPGQRMAAAELGVAVGAQHQQAHAVAFGRRRPQHMPQQQQHRFGRPVQVVQHQHHRPPSSQRPYSTIAPSSKAAWATSAAVRVLPTPGSPHSSTARQARPPPAGESAPGAPATLHGRHSRPSAQPTTAQENGTADRPPASASGSEAAGSASPSPGTVAGSRENSRQRSANPLSSRTPRSTKPEPTAGHQVAHRGRDQHLTGAGLGHDPRRQVDPNPATLPPPSSTSPVCNPLHPPRPHEAAIVCDPPVHPFAMVSPTDRR